VRARRSRRRVVAVVAVLALAGAGAAVAAFVADDEPSLTAKQLVAYQAAIHPPLSDGGRTVEQGMKPALADITDGGQVPVSAIAAESDRWVADLNAVRAKVAAVPPPGELRDAAALFDRALERYVAAAAAFGRAARAPVEQRQALLDEGIASAREADRTYDDASRVIQQWRRRLGLGATSDFPDP
jgi:hypothetical protein